jgi:hypothetical protein
MGRKSITGGITPAGSSRIQFDFIIDSVRFRPTLPWPATASNLERARKHLARIKAQIDAAAHQVGLNLCSLTRLGGRQRTPGHSPSRGTWDSCPALPVRLVVCLPLSQ